MTDLVEFLTARLDEDEKIARAAKGDWVDAESTQDALTHLQRWGADRVLADVAAKRRIVELHDGHHECSTYRHGEIDNCTWVTGDCSTLQLLAESYRDHPDYNPNWAVE